METIYQTVPSNLIIDAETTAIESSNYEATIISYVLQNLEGMAELQELIKTEDFDQIIYKMIWQSAVRLHDRNEPIELATVAIEMEVSGDLKRLTGGLSTLRGLAGAGLYGETVTRTAALSIAKQIVDRSRRRNFIAVAKQLLELAGDYTTPLEKLCSTAEESLSKVSYTAISESGLTWEAVLRLANEQNERRSEEYKNGSPTGLSFGLIDLDKKLGYAQPGQLIVVAGRPGMGKTAMLITMAVSMSKMVPVLVFSLEMSPEQLGNRALSASSGVDGSAMRDGSINELQLDQLLNAEKAINNLPIQIDDRSSVDINYIVSACRQYKAKHGQIAVFIDYLQLMEFGNNINMSIAVGLVTKKLKALARELQCPIVCLSQLNRGVESQNNKRPGLSDLRESGAIEQDSDAVVMLYRDEYYNVDSADRGICELIVAKNREGETGTVRVVFDGAHGRFKNLINGKN